MTQRQMIRQLNKKMLQVRKYKEQMAALSDEDLAGLTPIFKERLKKGETLDDLLPEAFAAICEADGRILGKFPYDVQVMGAIALHQGRLAQMNTGEGKTLVATMPLYLNALTGKSTMLMTTNEYLALRDAEEMGQVYRFMGLTVEAGVKKDASRDFTNEDKQKIYGADIVYTTHGTFGFDYLFNNLVTKAEDRFLRELYYVIVDEADSVLLDAAQTPLVISGSPEVQSNLYEMTDFFVTTLVEDVDYEMEEKAVWLTKEGIRRAERFFQIKNFFDPQYFEINRHVILALRAHKLYEMEKDYKIDNKGEMVLLDSGSGRMMPGVKLRGGQHQAIEVKEKLKPTLENRSVASITYQSLFHLFPKMAGMSGTIMDAKEELYQIYGVHVVAIPPNCPVRRIDLPDCYFQDADRQFDEAISLILNVHETGQPVLIVVSNIMETELVSKILVQQGIPHSVLNANNAFWEAEIIKEAGQMNAVTVATSMAGRGTDIKLGEGVKEKGGLYVVGIGRMNNIRNERQARGRAGRQGDPGKSQFFVSFEDETVKNNSMPKAIRKRRFITKGKMKRIVQRAQALGEEQAESARRSAVDYEVVFQRQREMIYEMRDNLLDGGTISLQTFLDIAKTNIDGFLKKNKVLTVNLLNRYILDNISYRLDSKLREVPLKDKRAVEGYLLDRVKRAFQDQEQKLDSREYRSAFFREATLQAIDDAWVDQVDYLQQLRSAVSGRSTAQRNPIWEYQNDSFESFQKMESDVYKDIMRNILLSNVHVNEEGKLQILLP